MISADNNIKNLTGCVGPIAPLIRLDGLGQATRGATQHDLAIDGSYSWVLFF
jgi:hypothetical protein